ncbi:MAG TPA: GAF domain-containing protein [Fimbriimonadales bacterium]|jgi:GAF domain-containing protein|nr:GAF domain-containing protein [Fimbriimonadales bacterium]
MEQVARRIEDCCLSGTPLRLFAMTLLAELPKYDWCGVYRLEGEVLVLDEFVGDPTEHRMISVGHGVCGTAVAENRNLIVADVHAVQNYLCCSIDTKSEIVVLIRSGELVLGQIDVDSHTRDAFGTSDEALLERIAAVLAQKWV